MMLLVNLKGVHVISRMCDVDNIHIDIHDVHDYLFDTSMDIYGILSITSPKTIPLSLLITTISFINIISVSQTKHGLAYPFK